MSINHAWFPVALNLLCRLYFPVQINTAVNFRSDRCGRRFTQIIMLLAPSALVATPSRPDQHFLRSTSRSAGAAIRSIPGNSVSSIPLVALNGSGSGTRRRPPGKRGSPERAAGSRARPRGGNRAATRRSDGCRGPRETQGVGPGARPPGWDPAHGGPSRKAHRRAFPGPGDVPGA